VTRVRRENLYAPTLRGVHKQEGGLTVSRNYDMLYCFLISLLSLLILYYLGLPLN
jgi:hypothetical protein